MKFVFMINCVYGMEFIARERVKRLELVAGGQEHFQSGQIPGRYFTACRYARNNLPLSPSHPERPEKALAMTTSSSLCSLLQRRRRRRIQKRSFDCSCWAKKERTGKEGGDCHPPTPSHGEIIALGWLIILKEHYYCHNIRLYCYWHGAVRTR